MRSETRFCRCSFSFFVSSVLAHFQGQSTLVPFKQSSLLPPNQDDYGKKSKEEEMLARYERHVPSSMDAHTIWSAQCWPHVPPCYALIDPTPVHYQRHCCIQYLVSLWVISKINL
ncbi:hypothetical protein KC19_1G193600 [Ceratodon purpureus]|uniref:Uncharacterized protein n=1 Tax=Ceratodon purpureus TaxID=3225 RepID=A0A8T0J967_CERPU|nr:hypothetical protein KC19_1G193600 [Ceratodon purpureus]